MNLSSLSFTFDFFNDLKFNLKEVVYYITEILYTLRF